MTKHVVEDDVLGMISRRSWEVQRRVMEGTLTPSFVIGNLQRIAEAKEIKMPTQSGLVVRNSPFFASEEVQSNYGYPQGYAVKPICEQLVALSKHFPNLDAGPMLACSKKLPEMPAGAEGPFVIPKWQKVADTYNESFEKALGMIAGTRTFHNYRKGQLGPKYLRQSERTIRAEEMIASMTNGDYMIIWAQFGLRWRGCSVRKVRYNYTHNEFGLGAFHSACMLLAHPERLQKWEQLHIDLPGDEYSPDADGGFSHFPLFGFSDGGVGFGARWVGDPFSCCGSASGFLSQ